MEKDNHNNSYRKPEWAEGMRLFGDMTTWIAVPIVAALVLGKFLDRRFGTEPAIFIALAGFGFLVTCWGILKTGREYAKRGSRRK